MMPDDQPRYTLDELAELYYRFMRDPQIGLNPTRMSPGAIRK
jgi:hypothetical protein